MGAAAKILAHGVACPLGLRSAPALAAIRAGLKVFDESELVFDRAGDGASSSALSLLPAETPRPARMRELGAIAIHEAWEPLSQARAQKVPCFIALPRGAALDARALAAALGARLGPLNPDLELDIRPSWLFHGGRAAAFEALRGALDAFARGSPGSPSSEGWTRSSIPRRCVPWRTMRSYSQPTTEVA